MFLAANLLAITVALGLSGSVALVSWLVPPESAEWAPSVPD